MNKLSICKTCTLFAYTIKFKAYYELQKIMTLNRIFEGDQTIYTFQTFFELEKQK